MTPGQELILIIVAALWLTAGVGIAAEFVRAPRNEAHR